LSKGLTLLLGLEYVGWSLLIRRIALLLDTSMLGGLCFSDGITLLLELEYIGCSLFVRPYNFTPRI
jgi:hypothetical protein